MNSILRPESFSGQRGPSRTGRMLANLLSVVGGEACLRIANFVAAILIARIGGATIFGIYATILAYVTIAVMLADNGLQIGTVREVIANPNLINSTFSKVLIAKTVLFIPMVLVLGVLGLASHLSKLEWTVAYLLTLRTVLQSYCQFQVAIIKAMGRMHVIGVIQAIHALFVIVSLWACYDRRAVIAIVLLVLVLGQVSEAALEAIWLHNRGVRLIHVQLRECWSILHGSTTMGIASGLSMGIMRLDVIVLSFIVGTGVAGLFAAAQTLLVIAYVLGSLVASVLFPEMNRLSKNFSALRLFTRRSMFIAAVGLVPCALVGMVVGSRLMPLLFGPKFGPSGNLLVLILPAGPFIVLNSISLHEAFALHKRKLYLGIYALAAIFTLIVDPTLALLYGSAGLAIAVVSREILLFAGFRIGLREHISSHLRVAGMFDGRMN